MTIFATSFGLVLGAWRLRIRIDLDEPRAEEIDERPAAAYRDDGAFDRSAAKWRVCSPRTQTH
ncbi:MAG TPA: hypothetical protein VGN14_07400 [Candidatus Elarobacter sp.]|jgi:hypothetical protein